MPPPTLSCTHSLNSLHSTRRAQAVHEREREELFHEAQKEKAGREKEERRQERKRRTAAFRELLERTPGIKVCDHRMHTHYMHTHYHTHCMHTHCMRMNSLPGIKVRFRSCTCRYGTLHIWYQEDLGDRTVAQLYM